MVCAPKLHHLEGEGLLAEVVRHAEPDRQVGLSEGLDAFAQRDTMKRHHAGPQLIRTDPHQS
jgi:hypothetical protein